MPNEISGQMTTASVTGLGVIFTEVAGVEKSVLVMKQEVHLNQSICVFSYFRFELPCIYTLEVVLY